MADKRLEQFQEVKELINGSESELFKGRYYGRYFSGPMTFVFDKTPYTLYLHNGTVIEAVIGKPINGIVVGIGGTQEQWDDFFKHRNFQLATSPKHNPLCFEILGSPLANRQNNNVVAQLMRVIARVMGE